MALPVKKPDQLLYHLSSCPLKGFENILNVDISRVAIHQMAETYKAYPMECEFNHSQTNCRHQQSECPWGKLAEASFLREYSHAHQTDI